MDASQFHPTSCLLLQHVHGIFELDINRTCYIIEFLDQVRPQFLLERLVLGVEVEPLEHIVIVVPLVLELLVLLLELLTLRLDLQRPLSEQVLYGLIGLLKDVLLLLVYAFE